MKRFILSTSLILLGAAAFAPTVLAKQLSTPGSLSESATITDLVQYNRDMRSKN